METARWRQKLRYPLQLYSRDKGPFTRPFHHNRTTSPLHLQVYRYHEALASHVSSTVSALFMSHPKPTRQSHLNHPTQAAPISSANPTSHAHIPWPHSSHASHSCLPHACLFYHPSSASAPLRSVALPRLEKASLGPGQKVAPTRPPLATSLASRLWHTRCKSRPQQMHLQRLDCAPYFWLSCAGPAEDTEGIMICGYVASASPLCIRGGMEIRGNNSLGGKAV